MRLACVGGVLLLIASASRATAATPAVEDESPMTLEQARSAALANSPVIRAADAEAAEARGRLEAARTYLYNPEIALEGANRDGPDGETTDRNVALTQQIEIAGQRGKRAAAGEAAESAALRRLDRRRQEVLANVEQAFAAALGARELMDVAAADLALTRNLLEFERRRLEAGAASQIQLNVARTTAGRSERRFQESRADWLAARSHLAEAAGLDPAKPPTPTGALIAPPAEIAALESLVSMALAQRPDLDSLRQEEERAIQQLELERSRAVPDLRLGVFSGRDEGDTVTGVGLGLVIPLFNRNQGGIAEARATIDRTGAETRQVELALLQEVTEARARLEAAVASRDALSNLVVGTLEDSMDLLRRSMEAGKVNATEVIVLRRELVEGQREYVEAVVEAWVARVDLDLATGGTTVPTTGGQPR